MTAEREKSNQAGTWTWWLLGLLALGSLVFSPAILAPLMLDDHWHDAMIRGQFPSARSPFNLYDFVGDADRALLIERGVLPWWVHPDLTIRFLRPLSSVLLWLERHWVRSPLLLHLHSFAWWAAMSFGAFRVYKKYLPRRAALLALATFALAPCHAIPLAWISNREALLSSTFGIFALEAWLALLEAPAWRHRARVFLLVCFMLLSGEYALCYVGYFATSLWFSARETRARSLKELPLVLLPTVLYLGVRKTLGYGARGSAFYSDPTQSLWVYLTTAPRRMATLIVDVVWSLDADTITISSWTMTVVCMFLVVASGLHVVRRVAVDNEGPLVRAFALGALCAIPALLAVIPSPRLLGSVLFGFAPLAGLVIERVWFGDEQHRWAFLVATCLAFFGLVHGPGASFVLSRKFADQAQVFEDSAARVAPTVGDAQTRELGVVRSMSAAFFLPFALNPESRMPKRVRILAQTGHVLMRRESDRAFELTAPPDASLIPTGVGNLFRPVNAPLARGDVLTVPGLQVTVTEVNDVGVRAARFQFAEPLETLFWIHERRGGFDPIELPEVGFGIVLDP